MSQPSSIPEYRKYIGWYLVPEESPNLKTVCSYHEVPSTSLSSHRWKNGPITMFLSNYHMGIRGRTLARELGQRSHLTMKENG